MKTISILGKILFLLICPIILFANVTASIDKIAVLRGDVVTYTITATGEDINLPELTNINGNKVLGTSNSTSMQIIHGKVSKTKSISYTFKPESTFTIPSYKVKIDGIDNPTQPLKVKVVEPTSSKVGDDLQLELNLSEDKAYVGQPITATIIFKYKVGLPLLRVELDEFRLKYFDIKPIGNNTKYEKDGYINLSQKFILTPKIAGDFTIPKQIINVAQREYRTNLTRWKKIFSNNQKINILPLPNGIDIQGSYTIEATIDKNITKINKPINLTITIQGIGNIDDIDEFKLNLDNQIVYSSRPIIKTSLQNNIYQGTFKQKISIVADENYTIPSISFKYFDTKQKTIKILSTKPFKIEVRGKKTTNSNIQTNNTTNIKTIQLPPKIIYKTKNPYIKYIYALIGLIIGILISYFIFRPKSIDKVLKPLQIRVKKAKNDKELYNILLPYSFNNKVVTIIKQLENNIYNNSNNKVNKKEILNIIDDENLK